MVLVDNVAKFKCLSTNPMKRLVLIALFVFSYLSLAAQSKINMRLKNQMDSVMVLDQKYRDTLSLLEDPKKADSTTKSLHYSSVSSALNHYDKMINRLDSLNLIFVESVFRKFGYPGSSLVGSKDNLSAWLIIQHSNKIDQYIDLIRKAAENGELPYRFYAMMLDRKLVSEGKEQIYGTQVICRKFKNIKEDCFVWPIKDPEKVNERRKAVGFDSTVEENAERLDVKYRVVKIEEVQ